MHIFHLATVLFAIPIMARDISEVYTEATSFSAMLARGEGIAKRQGYTPQQGTCGLGRTCQDTCGASYVQCPSTDNRIHCHNPSTGTQCCADGTGNACKVGYYCTTDGRGKTYCCPDGIQNAECARLYSLTISLIRATSLPTLSLSELQSNIPVVTPVLSASSRFHAPSAHSSASTSRVKPFSRNLTTSIAQPPSRTATSLVLPSSKADATSTRTASPQFSGGAARVVGAGIAVLAGAAVAFL